MHARVAVVQLQRAVLDPRAGVAILLRHRAEVAVAHRLKELVRAECGNRCHRLHLVAGYPAPKDWATPLSDPRSRASRTAMRLHPPRARSAGWYNLFFLIIRPPPGSTLFPYTTLFR